MAYGGYLPENCKTLLNLVYAGGSGGSHQAGCENFDGSVSNYELLNGVWYERVHLVRKK